MPVHCDSILFDLDGTLWDSVDEVLLTWNSVLARHPGLRSPITREEQERLMGMTMDAIGEKLFAGQPPQRQRELMDACMAEENRYLWEHGATLFPDLRETLSLLAEQYRLFIVSNCQSGYIEAFLHAHRLEGFFTGHLCFGDTGRGKADNIRTVVRQYGLLAPVYVGDTALDQESAMLAGVPFIHAAYGFGTVTGAQGIEEIRQLPALLAEKGGQAQ